MPDILVTFRGRSIGDRYVVTYTASKRVDVENPINIRWVEYEKTDGMGKGQYREGRKLQCIHSFLDPFTCS